MNAITFEAVVTPEHELRLPEEYPVGCRLRVTVEPIELIEWSDADASELPRSELGRTLLAIRERAVARGLALKPVDTILQEIRRDRGEPGDD